MKKPILLVLMLLTVLVLTACTKAETNEPQENPYQYLFDVGCTVSEVTILTHRDLFTNLDQDDLTTFNEAHSDDACAVHQLIQNIKDTHADEEIQRILVNRMIKGTLEEAITELALISDGLTLDVAATNYAIRADNVAEYIEMRTTYGLGGYFYNYFTSVNKWRYQNQFEEKGKIVFLGSSVVAAHSFDVYFPGMGIINRGIGGDYSDGFMNRLQVSVYDLEPSKVFFYCGGNDYAQGRTPQEITDKVELIIQDMLLHLNAEQIYLVSVYPINEDKASTPHSNTEINQQNALYEALAEEYGITFANVSDVLKDETGNMVAEYTSDGIHMNGAAYALLSEAMRPYIED